MRHVDNLNIVIIQTAFIGDVILCSSLIESLKSNGHRVSIVVRPEASNLFESDPGITDVFVFDKKGKDRGLTGLYYLAKKIRSTKYDVALVPHRSFRSALLVWLCRIPERIGFLNSAGSWLFTVKTEYDSSIHEIERNHSLANSIGISGKPPNPVIHITQNDVETAKRTLEDAGITDDDMIVGFGPGSKWFTKQWGTENYRELARLLLKQYQCKIICFGGNGEFDLGSRIEEQNRDKIKNFIGKLTLRESAAVLKRTALVIANDNGFMHLAAATGTPVVAIFGATVPGFGFSPWGDNNTIIEKDLYCRPCGIHGSNRCPEKHFRCMKEIDPVQVLDRTRRYMNVFRTV